jgi:hypothetical protein
VLGDGTVVPERLGASGTERDVGVELVVRREVTRRMYGWLSYTLLDGTHDVGGVVSYRPGRGWELGARARVILGRPRLGVAGATFASDTNDFVPLDAGDASLPAYVELDLRAEKTWTFRAWRLRAYIDVYNALNRGNGEQVAFDYRYRTRDVMTGLPIVPTFGVEGEW